MSCSHPADILCSRCPRPVRSELDVLLDRLDVQIYSAQFYAPEPERSFRLAALEAERRALLADREDFGDECAREAKREAAE